MCFDPDAASQPGAGVFGLPPRRGDAGVILIPAPFDGTASYGVGAARGPGAILEASRQIDLIDPVFGAVYERGIVMEAAPDWMREASVEARALAGPIMERGGAKPGDEDTAARIDDICERVRRSVRTRVERVLGEGRTPGVIGGEHSVSLGAIEACAASARERGEGGLGVLQIDAHMDLRRAFEGFRHSHASIIFNALETVPDLERVVQVGIRDFAPGERRYAVESGRVTTHFDAGWWKRRDEGAPFRALCQEAVDALPAHVYVTVDIDGLDPSLCPNTGTPVPGGLTFNEAGCLLETLRDSGRTVVGFDLCEVAPGGREEGWDANVGARILYRLCGLARAEGS